MYSRSTRVLITTYTFIDFSHILSRQFFSYYVLSAPCACVIIYFKQMIVIPNRPIFELGTDMNQSIQMSIESGIAKEINAMPLAANIADEAPALIAIFSRAISVIFISFMNPQTLIAIRKKIMDFQHGLIFCSVSQMMESSRIIRRINLHIILLELEKRRVY